MRVCQLSHVESVFNFVGPLITALERDGHEVVVACTLDKGGDVLRHHVRDGLPRHRVQVSRKVTLRAFTTEIVDLARYLRREQFDVVHLHMPLVSLQGRLAARLAGTPVVISHAHGFYFHDGMRAPLRRAHRAVERFFGRHLTDYIVTVNNDDLELARSRGFTTDPARVVGTPGVGVDTRRFRPLGPEVGLDVRRGLGIPDDDLVVTFVGRLVGEKGLLELASAFAQLLDDTPAWLLLVGDVSPSERDQDALARLDEIQRGTPAAGRTLRLGQRGDIPEILAATDVFVLPSYREGMPVSVLEAMACEVPVVTTDVRGCREAAAYGEAAVLVPARDVDALAEALRKLAADPDERSRIAAAGRAAVLARHTTEHGVAPVMAVYRRIGASRAAASGGMRRHVARVARRVLPGSVRARLTGPSRWRIAVQHVGDPLDPEPTRTSEVFTDAQLQELGLDFVADPFAVRRDGTWHLFFEQVRTGETRGEIGLATSDDLVSWTYRGVVLAEPFHLSYPQVLDWQGETYMIPETAESGSVRVYRAAAFPHRWELVDTPLTGLPYKDSTVLRHHDRWYLFSETSTTHTHDRLSLFVGPGPLGPWTEHPASPVVVGNPDAARCAGPVVTSGGRPVRLAQRCASRYGEAVAGFAVESLTPEEYREVPLAADVLRPRQGGWNAKATHHLDAHPVADGWIRFVDGYR